MNAPHRTALSLLLGVVIALPAAAAAPPDAPAARFEDLWAEQVRAEAGGDTEAAGRVLREIRRLRIERNVDSQDTIGMGLVLRGIERLDKGERERAEEAFRDAVAVAPRLPDAHFGLAQALLRKGVLGVLPSLGAWFAGWSAYSRSARGRLGLESLFTTAALLFVLALITTLAVALLLRRGGLLRHDIEEWLGPVRGRRAALALFLAVLLLPVLAFQGWGWLAPWWLALLFAYYGRAEKVALALLVALVLAVGPTFTALDERLRTAANPLYAAALDAVEGAPDAAALARLEQALAGDPQDRDLAYLLGAARKRAGLYDAAAQVYAGILAEDPSDEYARNNLAGIDFARGAYDAALARYKAGTIAGESAVLAATSHYNLSLAYLQKFDYQAFNEAKANADRLAPGLVAQYERWKYDTGDYAVVDVGLTAEQAWRKFEGAAEGVAARNVASGGRSTRRPPSLLASFLNRFTFGVALLAVFAAVIVRWRGPKAFTLHCARCGTAFCRHCHLGSLAGELCSQCYHLFVVRDGVSGPARNRKLAEVQRAEARRGRRFRVLTMLAPGSGHVFAGRTFVGLALIGAWYAPIALLLASRVVPLTQVSSRIAPPWSWVFAGVLLVAIWIGANRLRAEVELPLPTRRPGARRARVAQGA